MSEWVSVEERLPNDGEICAVKSNRYKMGVSVEAYFQEIPTWKVLGITHWMPLPEPPKE